ncbi:hypothetical protein BGZ80_003433 [Entomortierella chlamydospora]|uniref:Opi1-domain-containing protein n=1 Tax=Entomortierella chlamydospora TaxID=101097 RepID=A0A9P6SWY6_9FUNG|nr:hypothetical protein BGZ79_001149 [Entomortierella chlamydospora]KAG0008448.1 hypothetical protein BGZ80_003433 [Entomortierella chlamydospora]
MPSAKEMSKAQPMSISQLCQQDDLDDNLHNMKHNLDQDPLDLNSEDDHSPPYLNRPKGYAYSATNGHRSHTRRNGSVYDLPSDTEDDFAQYSNHRRRTNDDVPDSDEQLAAEVLGDMANARGADSTPTGGSFMSAAAGNPLFSRMTSLPGVSTALKAYENGKQNSKVVKYGAEMVESLSKPVFGKLEPTLGQLDDFACRQLDKVYPQKSEAHPFPSPTDSARSSNDLARPEGGSNGYFGRRARGDSIDSVSSNASSRPSFDVLRSRSTRYEESSLRDSQSSQRPLTSSSSSTSTSSTFQFTGVSSAPSQQFSGWKGVVATVGSASAAGVAIFSEESMKSLKYCLQWLQYAVHHIDHQIGLLRAFLVSLASPSKSTEIVPSTAASTLASIKKEVVDTLRKVINIVSRYAGACLPDHAKISVRQFILSMPVRWANLNNESVPSTPMGSPSLGPVDRPSEDIIALNETSERATRVLVFANESSDMLRSVASIFKDSVDKAENWMDKLRYVGMNPQNNSEGLPSWAPTGFPNVPSTMPGGFPGSGLEQYSLRQTQSNGHHGHATPTGSPTRSLKSSPRLSSRSQNTHHNRHAYRQSSVMSGDDSASEDEDVRGSLAMDDDSSFDEDDAFSLNASSGHGPMKRSMGSFAYTQGNAVRRRKKRGESAEVVAGLGVAPAANGHAIEQEIN